MLNVIKNCDKKLLVRYFNLNIIKLKKKKYEQINYAFFIFHIRNSMLI